MEFVWINNQLGLYSAAFEYLVELLGILNGYIPVFLATDYQGRGGYFTQIIERAH